MDEASSDALTEVEAAAELLSVSDEEGDEESLSVSESEEEEVTEDAARAAVARPPRRERGGGQETIEELSCESLRHILGTQNVENVDAERISHLNLDRQRITSESQELREREREGERGRESRCACATSRASVRREARRENRLTRFAVRLRPSLVWFPTNASPRHPGRGTFFVHVGHESLLAAQLA